MAQKPTKPEDDVKAEAPTTEEVQAPSSKAAPDAAPAEVDPRVVRDDYVVQTNVLFFRGAWHKKDAVVPALEPEARFHVLAGRLKKKS